MMHLGYSREHPETNRPGCRLNGKVKFVEVVFPVSGDLDAAVQKLSDRDSVIQSLASCRKKNRNYKSAPLRILMSCLENVKN